MLLQLLRYNITGSADPLHFDTKRTWKWNFAMWQNAMTRTSFQIRSKPIRDVLYINYWYPACMAGQFPPSFIAQSLAAAVLCR